MCIFWTWKNFYNHSLTIGVEVIKIHALGIRRAVINRPQREPFHFGRERDAGRVVNKIASRKIAACKQKGRDGKNQAMRKNCQQNPGCFHAADSVLGPKVCQQKTQKHEYKHEQLRILKLRQGRRIESAFPPSFQDGWWSCASIPARCAGLISVAAPRQASAELCFAHAVGRAGGPLPAADWHGRVLICHDGAQGTARPTQRYKAPEGWRIPRRLAFAGRLVPRVSVLECGGPPPLFSGAGCVFEISPPFQRRVLVSRIPAPAGRLNENKPVSVVPPGLVFDCGLKPGVETPGYFRLPLCGIAISDISASPCFPSAAVFARMAAKYNKFDSPAVRK